MKPGSFDAVINGCKCPIVENNFGNGDGSGVNVEPLFWYSSECDLHCGGDKDDSFAEKC